LNGLAHHTLLFAQAHWLIPPARRRVFAARCARANPRPRAAPSGAGRVAAAGVFAQALIAGSLPPSALRACDARALMIHQPRVSSGAQFGSDI
jgi:hypothetical protein